MDNFKIAMYTLEIAITYKCNFACSNCSTLVGVAPFDREMTIDEINAFLQDSADNKYPWDTISLYGGEPTVHPKFEEICKTLYRYKMEVDNKLRLQVVSNGTNMPLLNKVIDTYDFGPMVSPKTGSNRDHAGNLMPYDRRAESPVDIGREPTIGCWISGECGIAYNYLGFWPCSAGGAAARVFNFAPAARSTRDLTYEAIRECHTRICTHCGMGQHDRVQRRTVDEIISPTWKKALDAYNAAR